MNEAHLPGVSVDLYIFISKIIANHEGRSDSECQKNNTPI